MEIGQAQHAAQMPCSNECLARIEAVRQVAKVAGRAEPLGLLERAHVGADELQLFDETLEYAGIDVVYPASWAQTARQDRADVHYGVWDVDVEETSVGTAHLDFETCVVLVDNAYGRNLVSGAGWHLCKQTRILRWWLLLSSS